jgi:hypothetical protein
MRALFVSVDAVSLSLLPSAHTPSHSPDRNSYHFIALVMAFFCSSSLVLFRVHSSNVLSQATRGGLLCNKLSVSCVYSAAIMFGSCKGDATESYV